VRRIELQLGLTGALVFGIIALVAIGSGATSIILQNEITRGFERKMAVICSSMAAMLDAQKLEQIWRGREMVALAEFKGALYGIDKDGMLCRINIEAFGTATPMLKLPAPPSEKPALASNGNGLLFSAGNGDARQWQINPETQEVIQLPDAEVPVPLLVTGRGAEVREILPAADHPVRNALAVTLLGEELLALMPSGPNGSGGPSGQQILAFRNVDETASRVFMEAANLRMRSIATVGGQLYVAGDKLLKIGSDGIVQDFAAVANFADTRGHEYVEYRHSLLRIHARCDVTYLYAFRLEESDIVYIVDAVTDPSWTPIGYREALLPANGAGIKLARSENRPFVSPSMDYGLWGELKVSSAAVDEPGDQFPSMAGCDINVATIRSQTRHGIFLMLGAGVVTLLASLVITLKTARRITQPILELNRQTLIWASGEASQPITASELGDADQLADSFEAARRTRAAEERALLLEKIKARYSDLGMSAQDCEWLAHYLSAQSSELGAGTTKEPA
jgi:hypothetical protein